MLPGVLFAGLAFCCGLLFFDLLGCVLIAPFLLVLTAVRGRNYIVLCHYSFSGHQAVVRLFRLVISLSASSFSGFHKNVISIQLTTSPVVGREGLCSGLAVHWQNLIQDLRNSASR